MITERTERCPHCTALIGTAAAPGEAPGPRVCPTCGHVRITPRHEDVPKHVKRYVEWRLFLARFHPWHSLQESWEHAMATLYRGDGHHRWAIGSDDIYLELVRDADAWRDAGYPMDLTTPTHP